VLNVESAAVVGIDAGTPPAFLLAMRRPDLVRRLVLMEAVLSLRCAFEHYRAMPTTARQIEAATAERRLSVPALAIGAHPVGSALYQQLRQVGQDVTGLDIAECGHIIPLDRPEALLAALSDFLP